MKREQSRIGRKSGLEKETGLREIKGNREQIVKRKAQSRKGKKPQQHTPNSVRGARGTNGANGQYGRNRIESPEDRKKSFKKITRVIKGIGTKGQGCMFVVVGRGSLLRSRNLETSKVQEIREEDNATPATTLRLRVLELGTLRPSCQVMQKNPCDVV